MGERVFKTLDQQLDILVTRGVNIKDEDSESAKDFLLKNNHLCRLRFDRTNCKTAISKTVIANPDKIRDKIQAYPTIGEGLITS